MTGKMLSSFGFCAAPETTEGAIVHDAVWDPSWPHPPRSPDRIPVAKGWVEVRLHPQKGWLSLSAWLEPAGETNDTRRE